MEKSMLDVLKEYGVLNTGHFILPSGKHSDKYIQCAKLFQYPDKAKEFLEIVIEEIKDSGLSFDVILGPAIGGILISYELARHFKKPMVYIERECGDMALNKEFEIKKGQKILIADDVITSGKTITESIKFVESLCGEVVGVVCIVNKESLKIKQKIYSCIDLNFKSYYDYECPLCKKNIPIQENK